MDENKRASEVVRDAESQSVSEWLKRKMECVRSAEDAPNRIPRLRKLLYASIIAQIDTQIGMCEVYEDGGVNYPRHRRELARHEAVTQRMQTEHESREMAGMVLDAIAEQERERNRALIGLLTKEQMEELVRSAAARQIELTSQPRYVKARIGLSVTRDHLYELRQLRVLIVNLLGKGE